MRAPKPNALLRIVTNSERASFACQRRWFFRYILGLTSHDNPAPLRMGTLWHQCLAALYRAIQQIQRGQVAPWTDLGAWASVLADAVIGPWLEARTAYAMTTEMSHEQRAEVMQEDQEAAALTRAMFRGYVAAWAALDLERWEILHVEAQVARPLLHPVKGTPLVDFVKVNGKRRRRVWHYGGQLDLVIRKKSDGSVWFVEHKSAKDKDLAQYKRKLHWDPQIRGYAWAIRKPIPTSEIAAMEPVGVIYNVARKKIPEPPELVSATKKDQERMPRSVCSVPGDDGKPALKRLSLKAIDTTRDVFMGEIQRLGFDPDDHADALEKLRGNIFFDRETIPLTVPELEDFERDATHSAMQKMKAQKATYHPRQVDACTGVAPYPCPYAGSVCMADGPMARRSFTTMGVRHAELTGDFAEPYVAQEDARINAVQRKPARAPDTFAVLEEHPLPTGKSPFDDEKSALTPPKNDGTFDPFAAVE